MGKESKIKITSEDLKKAFEDDDQNDVEDLKYISPYSRKKLGKKTDKNGGKDQHLGLKKSRQDLIFAIIGIAGVVIGGICLTIGLIHNQPNGGQVVFPEVPSRQSENKKYSKLTGEPLAEGAIENAPTYCIQIPNGLDGARPQAGLDQAGVIFEAIAEAGITRFAAVFQNPTSAVIGPIRSLRSYYLEWDTPFDCVIVHAGGSDDALAAVSNGYKNLDENYSYMYRGTYDGRGWNNLFISAAALGRFSNDIGDTETNIKGLARLTPSESAHQRVDDSITERLIITKPTANNTSELLDTVNNITLDLGGAVDFSVRYAYNKDDNNYLRSYGSGAPHERYSCPNEDLGDKNPEEICSLTEMSPSVVVAMVVQESRAYDNYHEDITTIGSGDVYIFQNGIVINGTWQKASADDQIRFTSQDGREIKLAPGQTIITAVPQYGSIAY